MVRSLQSLSDPSLTILLLMNLIPRYYQSLHTSDSCFGSRYLVSWRRSVVSLVLHFLVLIHLLLVPLFPKMTRCV